MRYDKLLVVLSLFLLLMGCKTSRNCQLPLEDLISKRIEADSTYASDYKQIEIKRKQQIIEAFCSQLAEQKKLLIIETVADNVYGLIYSYGNHGNVYTYEQRLDKLSTSNNYLHDKFGNGKALLLSIDSTDIVNSLLSKERLSKSKQALDDSYPVRIYYIDIESNSVNYFSLK